MPFYVRKGAFIVACIINTGQYQLFFNLSICCFHGSYFTLGASVIGILLSFELTFLTHITDMMPSGSLIFKISGPYF